MCNDFVSTKSCKMGEPLEVVLIQIDLLALNIENLESSERKDAMMMLSDIISNVQNTLWKPDHNPNLAVEEENKNEKAIEKMKINSPNKTEKHCPVCDKNVPNHFKRHMNRHLETHKCKKCSKVFRESSSLKKHTDNGKMCEIFMKRKSLPLIFSCDKCDFKSHTKRNLYYHQVRHSGRHQCAKCQHQFYSLKDLQKHLKSSQNCEKYISKV